MTLFQLFFGLFILAASYILTLYALISAWRSGYIHAILAIILFSIIGGALVVLAEKGIDIYRDTQAIVVREHPAEFQQTLVIDDTIYKGKDTFLIVHYK